jgi:uncharacterized membrane protein YphA (DoxX/SURF4 family)
MTTTHELTAARSNGRLIALWLLSGLVALVFLGAGGGKLAGAAAMVEVFDKVGLGQWFRYVTGVLEVGGAVGLLIPGYAFYAAALLAVVMVGAIIAEVTVVGHSALPAVVLLGLTAIIAYLRKP